METLPKKLVQLSAANTNVVAAVGGLLDTGNFSVDSKLEADAKQFQQRITAMTSLYTALSGTPAVYCIDAALDVQEMCLCIRDRAQEVCSAHC